MAILLSGAVFETKKVNIPKVLPRKIRLNYIEEPKYRSLGDNLHWCVERNLFGVYVYITAPDEILEQVVTFFSQDMKLNIISWGETLDPLWKDKYLWSIRLSSGLSIDNIRLSLNRTLDGELLERYTTIKKPPPIPSVSEQVHMELAKQKKDFQNEIEAIQAEKVTVLEQKDAEVAYLYEELERFISSLRKHKSRHATLERAWSSLN